MKLLLHMRGDVVGGAETHAMTLANELAKLGHSVLITVEHKRLLDYVQQSKHSSRIAVSTIITAKDLARKLQSWKPEIFQFYHSQTAYRSISMARWLGKVVEIAHNQTYFDGCCTTYPKDRTDLVICVSKEVEAFYYSQGGSARTVIVPNGIDPGIFYSEKRRPRRGRKLLLGFSGRLEHGAGKGIPQMLEMVAQRQKSVDLELVGYDQGGYRSQLPPNAKIFPFTKDIAPFYRRWDVLISCSPKEGFGLTIAEGYMCGCKVLAYNCGGICGFLRNGDDALIYDTYHGVAEGLDLLIKGKTLNCYPDKFSSETMAQSYVRLYTSLLGHTGQESNTIERNHLVVPETEMSTLGVVPPSFYGVKKSIEHLCDIMVPPGSVSIGLLSRGVKRVYFGGFSEEAARDLQAIRNYDPGIASVVTWQGSFVLGGYNRVNTDLFTLMARCCKAGLVDSVLCPHPGIARALGDILPVPCGVLDNTLAAMAKAKQWLLPYRDSDGVIPDDHIAVSMMGSGAPWKNIETGVVSCAVLSKMVGKPVHLHVSGGNRDDLDSLSEVVGIQVVYHRLHSPDNLQPYFDTLRGMHLSLCIGMSETYGFAAVESFMIGVPAVVCGYHPSIKTTSPDILQNCAISSPDDPTEIAERMGVVLRNRRSIMRAGKRFYWSKYDDTGR